MANIAYQYRLYPGTQQMALLQKTFGCVRFVYNQILDKQQENYKNGKPHMSKFTANTYCNHELKTEYEWLKEVDKFALTNAVFHCCDGFAKFFKKQGGYPKFKNKHRAKKSYTTNSTSGNIKVMEQWIQLPKVGKIKAKIHRSAPGGYFIKSATVSQEREGSYYVSVLYEYENKAGKIGKIKRVIGLDYKSDGLYADSEGKVCGSPKYYRKAQEKLAKEQRKLKGKIGNKKGGIKSKNYIKQIKKVNRVHRHIANQRKDFLHKTSSEIANQYDAVCVESLDMRKLSNKGFGNGKATMDNGYGNFVTMLEYKLARQGKYLIKVDKWYPSSQICSECGRRKKIRLRERIYRCKCGATGDRDYNAAKNIREEGLRILKKIG